MTLIFTKALSDSTNKTHLQKSQQMLTMMQLLQLLLTVPYVSLTPADISNKAELLGNGTKHCIL